MGICKCKKRTDLFCFVHKKAVCENCICTDHQTCVVKTYVDWLTDSEYDPATCGICKGGFTEGNVIRLTCLDMFHPECLDVYASSLPPHTAKAGYVCPTCSKPIFPPDEITPLAQQLQTHLSNAPWSRHLLSSAKVQVEDNRISASTVEKRIKHDDTIAIPIIHTNETTDGGFNLGNSGNSLKRVSVTPNAGSEIPNSPPTTSAYSDYGIASRKGAYSRDHTLYIDDNQDDEDKYKKKGVMQLFVALGLVKPSSDVVKGSKTRIRLDTRRLLVLFAIFTCLITVIVLGLSLTTEDTEDSSEVAAE